MPMIFHRFPSAPGFTAKERRALNRVVHGDWSGPVRKDVSLSRACLDAGVNLTRLRKKAAFPAFEAECALYHAEWALLADHEKQYGPGSLENVPPTPFLDLVLPGDEEPETPPAEDLETDRLLAEIESRGAVSVRTELQDDLTHPTTQATTPEAPQQALMSEKPAPEAENQPVAPRNDESASDREIRLAKALEAIEAEAAEKPPTQQELIDQLYPPTFDEPVDHAPAPRKFTMLDVIQEGERAAEQERQNLGWKLYQQRHYEQHGGQYMQETETMRRAREANQR
jgi:hypothetical protein